MADGMGVTDHESRDGAGGWDERLGRALSREEERVIELMREFQHRQQRRPDLAVRPWWSAGDAGAAGRVGFVVEYCPAGRESAELVVRGCRLTVEGPAGVLEARLDLSGGWLLDGVDTGSPDTLANHLLRLADRVLEEAA